jgi:hypothetical protein
MSIHKIVDVTTGEETLVDYTKAQKEEQAEFQAAVAKAITAAALKAEAKAKLLARLGITEEEAELLL